VSADSRYTGWVSFAAWLMVTIGALYILEGLIAIIRDQYYVLTDNQIIVFDLRTWGWVMLIWGIIVGLAGYGLISGAGWARWVAIVVSTISVLIQLTFVGGATYPLWAPTLIAFCVIVIYALLVHWDEVRGTV
jgi:hypothetical protein